MHSKQESKIEEFAFDYLKAYYTQRHSVEDVHVHMGEKAKNGTIADGLFTYCKSDEEPIFVAALITEASEKLARMLVAYKKKTFKNVNYGITAIVTALAGAIAYLLSDNLVFTGAAILFALPVAYFTSFFTHRTIRQRQVSNVVEAFKRLPSNQKWLGISISSQIVKRNKLADHLLAVCRERGIGVLTVGKRSKVVLMLEPQNTTRRQGDYLSYYKSEISIRKEILGDKIMRVA